MKIVLVYLVSFFILSDFWDLGLFNCIEGNNTIDIGNNICQLRRIFLSFDSYYK